MGDMLHYLPAVDPEFSELREKFRDSLTREQKTTDKRAWEESGDNRSLEAWFEATRLDAYIRGLLYPDEKNDWKDVYTGDQRKIGIEMRSHVESP